MRASEALTESNSWAARNISSIKIAFRAIFGLVWLVDGALKFSNEVIANLPDMVRAAGDGQPSWLAPWFSFWAQQTAQNATFWVYFTGALEVALGLALVLGLARKLAYLGGAILSLFIWAVPEGFGGPYGPSSTDIGTGVVYALVFLALLVINGLAGPSRGSLDTWIERRYAAWSRIAEVASAGTPTSPRQPGVPG